MWFSQTQLQRSVAHHRRLIRSILEQQIQDNDAQLVALTDSLLPIRSDNRRQPNGNRSPQWEQIQELRAVAGRGFQVSGQPFFSRFSSVCIDELLGSLQERGLARSDQEAVHLLAGLIVTSRRLRGRGGRYGCISHGVSLGTAQGVSDDELTMMLAVGELDATSKELQNLLEPITSQVHESALTEHRRGLFARLERDGESDERYRDLFVPEYAYLIDVVMSDPRRPRRLTWRQLAIEALGITVNQAATPVVVEQIAA